MRGEDKRKTEKGVNRGGGYRGHIPPKKGNSGGGVKGGGPKIEGGRKISLWGTKVLCPKREPNNSKKQGKKKEHTLWSGQTPDHRGGLGGGGGGGGGFERGKDVWHMEG